MSTPILPGQSVEEIVMQEVKRYEQETGRSISKKLIRKKILDLKSSNSHKTRNI